jgi:hypothetical protein
VATTDDDDFLRPFFDNFCDFLEKGKNSPKEENLNLNLFKIEQKSFSAKKKYNKKIS